MPVDQHATGRARELYQKFKARLNELSTVLSPMNPMSFLLSHDSRSLTRIQVPKRELSARQVSHPFAVTGASGAGDSARKRSTS